MRRLLLLLALLLVPGAAVAQPTAATRLNAKDLQADVAILRRAYETLHPGLYRYNTPEQMDKRSVTSSRNSGRTGRWRRRISRSRSSRPR